MTEHIIKGPSIQKLKYNGMKVLHECFPSSSFFFSLQNLSVALGIRMFASVCSKYSHLRNANIWMHCDSHKLLIED